MRTGQETRQAVALSQVTLLLVFARCGTRPHPGSWIQASESATPHSAIDFGVRGREELGDPARREGHSTASDRSSARLEPRHRAKSLHRLKSDGIAMQPARMEFSEPDRSLAAHSWARARSEPVKSKQVRPLRWRDGGEPGTFRSGLPLAIAGVHATSQPERRALAAGDGEGGALATRIPERRNGSKGSTPQTNQPRSS